MSEEMWKNNGADAPLPVHVQNVGTNVNNASNRIQMQLHPRKRKRKHPSASTSILSGSSSSSSEDEDDDANFANNANYSRNASSDHRSQDSQSKRQQQQPEGWRVKLYRLNADGSWDDCGTGRIVCLYKTSSTASSESPQEQLYQELGEPTLCMQAEQTSPRVLLRTKILLREAYQRQGDNIITWCEPYFEDSSSQQQEGQPQGVSFVILHSKSCTVLPICALLSVAYIAVCISVC
jgi:hypothetical protein